MSTQNLWGSLPEVGEVAAPLGILRQQAALLGDMANNLLEAQVIVRQRSAKLMAADLVIVAPPLDGYTISILRIEHKLELYPLKVWNLLTETPLREVLNEEAFLAALRMILQSTEVRRAIESLLVQIKATE